MRTAPVVAGAAAVLAGAVGAAVLAFASGPNDPVRISEDQPAASTSGALSASPASPPPRWTRTRLAVAGDTGTGPRNPVTRTVEVMVDQSRRRPYDGLVLLGDLVYPDGDGDQAPRKVTMVFEPVLEQGAELVAALGNHDYQSGDQREILDEVGRTRSWYVARIGEVRIVVLDTERVDSPQQTAWLRSTLARPTDAAWTIVAMHRAPYSAGRHGSYAPLQERWVPLFEKYDVPLVLAGHDHDYQRSKLIDGVTYVVSGGAATLRPTGSEDFTEVSVSTYHYVDLLADDRRLRLRALDQRGRVFDSVELTQ